MKYNKVLNERLSDIPCIILHGSTEEKLIEIAQDILHAQPFILLDYTVEKDKLKTIIHNLSMHKTKPTIIVHKIHNCDIKIKSCSQCKFILIIPKLINAASYTEGLVLYCPDSANILQEPVILQIDQLLANMIKTPNYDAIMQMKTLCIKLCKSKVSLESIAKHYINKYKKRKTIHEIVELAASCTKTVGMTPIEYYLLYERFFIKLSKLL
jgi:hypothetical protein